MVFSCPGQLKPPAGPSGLYSPLELLTAVRYENSFHVLMANMAKRSRSILRAREKGALCPPGLQPAHTFLQLLFMFQLLCFRTGTRTVL